MKPTNVDEYIANAPREMQGKLRQLRRIIQEIAPAAEERISYGMPFYDYKGRLVYFAAMKNYIGLYIPPPIFQNFKKELAEYTRTKSALHLPQSESLPTDLIARLIKARMQHNQLQQQMKH